VRTLDLQGVATPLSQAVLGTMTFGDTADEATSRSMVDAALDAGVTAIDTANGYAGTRSETIVGAAIRGRRDKIVLATKAGIYGGDAEGAPLLSPAGLRSSLTASLKRLDVGDVDVFYLHQPDRTVPIGETLGALGELIDEGLIRAYGVSNYAAWQVGDILRAADDLGVPRPVLSQQMYSLVGRRIEAEYSEFAVTANVPTIVYNPLGGGLLSGRHHPGEQPSAGRFGTSSLSAMYRERYWKDTLLQAVSQLADVAAAAGIGVPELALRWLLAKPVVSAILIGASKLEHLRANLAAIERGPLPADVVERCDEIGEAIAGPMPAYNR
jgi:aryl-alcohol dehydrogenase-like predicted oxidoreductase